MNEAKHSMRSRKTWHCVPQSCSLALTSIILFVTHHDDFHMGAELELCIQLLLAFHDFFEGVSLTMHIFFSSRFLSVDSL